MDISEWDFYKPTGKKLKSAIALWLDEIEEKRTFRSSIVKKYSADTDFYVGNFGGIMGFMSVKDEFKELFRRKNRRTSMLTPKGSSKEAKRIRKEMGQCSYSSSHNFLEDFKLMSMKMRKRDGGFGMQKSQFVMNDAGYQLICVPKGECPNATGVKKVTYVTYLKHFNE